jgi:hypothetical protein
MVTQRIDSGIAQAVRRNTGTPPRLGGRLATRDLRESKTRASALVRESRRKNELSSLNRMSRLEAETQVAPDGDVSRSRTSGHAS